MKLLTRLFVQFGAILVLLAVPVVAVQPVAAQNCFGQAGGGDVNIARCADTGACLDTAATNCANQGSAENRVNEIIKLVINFFSFIVGVVAVIMVIIGGFKYITSGGESSNVAGAKNTILYAIIGLIIVALAQVIVRFVLGKATV